MTFGVQIPSRCWARDWNRVAVAEGWAEMPTLLRCLHFAFSPGWTQGAAGAGSVSGPPTSRPCLNGVKPLGYELCFSFEWGFEFPWGHSNSFRPFPRRRLKERDRQRFSQDSGLLGRAGEFEYVPGTGRLGDQVPVTPDLGFEGGQPVTPVYDPGGAGEGAGGY